MSSIHYPVISVPLKSGSVEVSDLPWAVAKELFAKLHAQGKAFVNEKGELVYDANKILAAISDCIDLCEWIAIKATGKDQEWINERSLSEIMHVVETAIVLNVDAIRSRVKNVRSRLTQAEAGEATK